MSELKKYYGEGGWSKEDGVKAVEQFVKTTYWKNDTELKLIDGASLKAVGKMIEKNIEKDQVYNCFCGRLIADIKTLKSLPHCKRCHFFGICYSGGDILKRKEVNDG